MPSPDIFGPELSIADIFVTAVPSIQIWASSSQRTQCFPPELYSWQGGGASESPHLLKKAQETPGRARCLNGKLITPKLDKRAKKTRTTVLSKTEGQIWQKNVTKRSVSFLPGEHEGRNVGFSTRAIAAMLSQKSSRRPGEEFLTKGQKGERRWFIWKCLSVIMMSCFPAHRVQPRCGMKECQGQRQTQDSDCALESDEGSAINFLFSPYMHVSENAFLKRALRASFPWHLFALSPQSPSDRDAFTQTSKRTLDRGVTTKSVRGGRRGVWGEGVCVCGGVRTYLSPKLCAEVSL